MLPGKKAVLFVDDEQRVLDGIRRMLHPLRARFDMEFVTSASEALAVMERRPFAVVVSDIRMPGMNGVEFLREASVRFPHACRIILSGQAEKEQVLRDLGPIHQYLSKPCDAATLQSTLVRVCELHRILSHPQLTQLVNQIESLPSLPAALDELMAHLETPGASLSQAGQIIARDVGMSAKVLQLVNSAFFGLPRRVASPLDAVRLLGLETVRALALSLHVFSRFGDVQLRSFRYESLLQRAVHSGSLAKEFARMAGAPASVADDAFIAGLLHDVGSLVFASRLPEKFRAALRLAEEQHRSASELEAEVIGASHAEVGAYLLGLWGFASPVVEAVAYHHRPSLSATGGLSPLAVVHAAVSLTSADHATSPIPLDSDYLRRCGLLEWLPAWRDLSRSDTRKEAVSA